MEVQETVWDFFDQDGNFVADKTIKNKDDLISRFVKHWFRFNGS